MSISQDNQEEFATMAENEIPVDGEN